MADDLALHSRTLPAAFLRGWDGQHGALLAAARAVVAPAEGSDRPGVRWLRDDLCAVLPVPGDPAVYDVALHVAFELVAAARAAAPGGDAPRLGLLVLSGRVRFADGALTPESERLLDDLERRPPEVGTEPVWATSLVASRLEAPRRIGSRTVYSGPSGTRVPIFAVGAEDRTADPWRSPTLFRRRTEGVRRPDVERMVAGPGVVEALRVTGPLGCGKTRAVWQALAAVGGAVVRAAARPVRHRGPSLAAQIVHDLAVSGSGGAGEIGPRRGDLEELGIPDTGRLLDPGAPPGGLGDSRRMAERIAAWLAVRRRAGKPASLVLDDLEGAGAPDLDLARALGQAAVDGGGFHLLLIHRQGRGGDGASPLPDLPQVRVPPMEPEEMELFRRAACQGLSLPDEITERLLAEAAGHPFAFEEGLAALAEQDLIREIHGNLFFRGERAIGYTPSNRLMQHVEAEAGRLGPTAPLRILALAGDAVPDGRIRAAARSAGVEVGSGWAIPFLEGGLLREAVGPWGPGMALACPAWADALRTVAPADEAARLRRHLGEVLADQTSSGAWRTYRMLEGSERAVRPLLSAAREREAPPGELLAALRTELTLVRSSGRVDPDVELELLWALLPLAHRLEGLAESRADLERARQLAADDPKKLTALAGLEAELAEEEGRLEDAETILRRALHRSREVAAGQGAQSQALLVLRLARLLIRRERHGEARELLERVIPILDRSDARALSASARFHLANVALHQNRLDQAMDLHGQALEARRRLERPKPIGQSLSAMGRVALQMGRYTEAVACYREAEEVFLGCGESEEGSFALMGLGRAAGRLGDHVGASRPLRQALDLREEHGDRTGEAIARLAVAENYLFLGQPATALEEARRAHFDLSMASAKISLADAEQLLGRIALVQRDLPRAKRHLTIALDGHRRCDGPEGAAFDLAFLLEVELQKGDPYEISRLVSELETALASSPAIERREILEIRLYRGLVRLDRQERARPFLEEAYRRLMTKTEYLPQDLRHRFLFQIPEHEQIVHAATDEAIA